MSTRHLPPAPGENALNLNQRGGLTYGLQLPLEARAQLQRPKMQFPGSQDMAGTSAAMSPMANAYGRSEGAAQTPTVESGSIVEALAAAIEGGLHGRSARMERQADLDETARARKMEDAQRNSFVAALGVMGDPSLEGSQRTNRIAEALAGGDPQAAFEYRQSQEPTARQRQLETIISQLPPDQQAFARLDPEGFVRGMMRHRYPAPQRAGANGVNPYPPVPDGFVLDD